MHALTHFLGSSMGVTVYLDPARALPRLRDVGPGWVHRGMVAVVAQASVGPREGRPSTGTGHPVGQLATDLRSQEIFTEACGFAGGWLVFKIYLF